MASLLLEIGAEEIPASFVAPALEELATVLKERAAAVHLALGEVKTYGTPRRLALLAHGVGERSEDLTREVSGPSVKAAFDAEGKPTRAAEKFAESVGKQVADLARTQTPKGEYLTASVHEAGKAAAELLRPILQDAIHNIHFKKSMRWGTLSQTFARPVHWIVALLGHEVLPLTLADVRSGRVTRGHRFLAPDPITLASPEGYVQALRGAHVQVDIAERRQTILDRTREVARAAGGTLLEDEALLEQVTQLVELPSPIMGSFDERHLDLPMEVLVQEMKSHQRYFSVVGQDGKLLPRFIAVSNTPVRDEAVSRRGYERVLRARLADGRFFFDEDRKAPLDTRLEKLGRVVWQGRLGSYAEKVERFRALAVFLTRELKKDALIPLVERAATLAKADLVTGMVGEFPELQGVMGREYARAGGEPAEVALAIDEHYLPRGATDRLPTQDVGALVGLADRLDSLVGLFAIGKAPSGAADPFALRRACLAFINIVLGRGYRLSLSGAVKEALRLVAPKVASSAPPAKPEKPGQKPAPAKVETPTDVQVLEFFRGRLKALWSEHHRADVVEAVLSSGFDDLVATQQRLDALSKLVTSPDFIPLAAAFKRVVNIVEKQAAAVPPGAVDGALLKEPAEQALHTAVASVATAVAGLTAKSDYSAALERIASLKGPVDRFFADVMVMAEDRAIRENRVRLLMDIRKLFDPVADFSRIQSETVAEGSPRAA